MSKQLSTWNFKLLFKFILLIPAIFLALSVYNLGAILLYPYVTSPSCAAKTILVMGAAQYNGVPSPAFQRRLDKALELYNSGCGSQIIVTGGSQVGDNYSEGITGAAYLYYFGVPKGDLYSETKSTTSFENLTFSKTIVADKKLTIVTDDLHAYRTFYLAKRLGYSAEVVGVYAPYKRWSYGFNELKKLMAYHVGILR